MKSLLWSSPFALLSLSVMAATVHAAETDHHVSHPVIAIFRAGDWVIDSNNDHAFNARIDEVIAFGEAGDWPLSMPRTYCGSTPLVVSGTTWQLHIQGSGGAFVFGEEGMIPLFKGLSPASFVDGLWHVDDNRDGHWDTRYLFGMAGDLPVFGRWKRNQDDLGVFDPRTGIWYLDASGDGQWDAREDQQFQFGAPGDIPVVGDFNRDRPGDEIGTFRDGYWLIDMDGNRRWNASKDAQWSFGQAGDIPVVLLRCG